MTITWLGHSCFELKDKEVTIITDPYDPKVGFKLRGLAADIVTVSHDHFDHNYLEAVKGEPFVIKGPGEYEIKNVLVYGITSWHDKKEGAERGANTIYRFEVDNLSIAHLGDMGQEKLTDDQIAKLEGVDILLIPIGGEYTLSAKEAVEIISQIEPRIVIPMHYKYPGIKINLEGTEKFCKEIGICKREAVDKLKITKKDLPQEDMEVILMKMM